MLRRLLIIIVFSVFSGFYCSSPPEVEDGSGGRSSALPGQFQTFSFQQKDNTALVYNFTGSVNNTANTVFVTIKQSSNVDLTSLKASFTFDGSYVMVGKEVQQSTITVNNFLKPLNYRIFSENGSFTDYKVTVVFAMTYPYKPEIYDVFIKGDIVSGRTLTLDYTYRDRNGDRQKGTKVEWKVETEPYSGIYSVEKTEYVTDDELPLDSGEIRQNSLSFAVPAEEGCKVIVTITPGSEIPVENPTLPVEYLTGYSVTGRTNLCIKKGTAAGLIIDEICVGDNGSSYDEYIVLYNTTGSPISLNGLKISYYTGGGWLDYCLFDDSEIIKPESFGVTKTVPPKGYFLIARETSSISIKRIADVVLKLPSADIPPNSGAVGLICIADNHMVDLIGYGESLAPFYEGHNVAGKGAKIPNHGDKLIRYNHGDSNDNYKDVILRDATNPSSSGQNIIGDAPYIKNESVQIDPVTGGFEVVYEYFDWQYSLEGDTKYNWEILVAVDGQPGQFALPVPAVDPFYSMDGRSFVMVDEDYDLLPIGKAPYLRVTVTPESSEGRTGSAKTVYYEVAGIKAPLAPARPARLVISRVFLSQNIIELYAEKGGSLGGIRLGRTMSRYDNEDPKQDLPWTLITPLDDSIIYSGNYVLVQTKPNGDTGWTNIAHIKKDAYHLIDTGFSVYKGVVFDVLRRTSLESEPEETYEVDDTLVIGLNNPSDLSPAIKRYIALNNRKRLASPEGRIIWKTSFDNYPYETQTLFNKYKNISFAEGSNPAFPDDDEICGNINALNDYVIVSQSSPGNYMMYRSASDINIGGDFLFDFIAPVEFFLNDGLIYNYNGGDFIVTDPDLPSENYVPYVEIPINLLGTVDSSSVSLDQISLNLVKTSTRRLVPSLTPALSPDTKVNEINWTSSQPLIASVDQTGLITALSVGSTTIKLTIKVNAILSIDSSCNVTVSPVFPETRTKWIYLEYNGTLKLRDVSNYSGAFPLVKVDYTNSGISSYSSVFNRGSVGFHEFPLNKLIERRLENINGVFRPLDTDRKEDFEVKNSPVDATGFVSR